SARRGAFGPAPFLEAMHVELHTLGAFRSGVPTALPAARVFEEIEHAAYGCEFEDAGTRADRIAVQSAVGEVFNRGQRAQEDPHLAVVGSWICQARCVVKTLLVVGSAPCLFEDVARGLQLRPFASLMLVNGACTAFETAEHVLAGHEEKAEFFARARRERFPNAPPWRLHASTHPHRQKACKELFPSVTDWWPHEVGVAATSASKAAKIGF